MRIAIFGAGGLGAYYGVRLLEAGHEVWFIARGAHLAAMRESGLEVASPLGDARVEHPQATDDPAEVGEVDLVVVAVKTWQIPEAARSMAPLVGSGTAVVPFLNGVEAPYELAAALGRDRVLGGLSRIFALMESPGRIRHFNDSAYVALGELDGSPGERVRRLREVFEAAGVEVETPARMEAALWEKLVTVTSWAGLGALTRSPIGVLRAEPVTRDLIDRAMDETIQVAEARGVAPGPKFKAWLWGFYDSLPEGATASLQRDIMAGRPSELEAWNGAVSRLGGELGVETPVHTFVHHALLPMERMARGAPAS